MKTGLVCRTKAICCHLYCYLADWQYAKNSCAAWWWKSSFCFLLYCQKTQFFIPPRQAFGFVFYLPFDMLLFMRRAKRNIPLTGALLSPDINHWHGNETILTKGETDGGIQMQRHYADIPSVPLLFSISHKGTSPFGTTSEWTIRGATKVWCGFKGWDMRGDFCIHHFNIYSTYFPWFPSCCQSGNGFSFHLGMFEEWLSWEQICCLCSKKKKSPIINLLTLAHLQMQWSIIQYKGNKLLAEMK